MASILQMKPLDSAVSSAIDTISNRREAICKFNAFEFNWVEQEKRMQELLFIVSHMTVSMNGK